MSDTSVLKSIFNRTACIEIPQPDHQKHRINVILTEPKAPESKLEVAGLPGDAIIIDVDGAFSNERLFNRDRGACKRADFIIISESKQTVVFIEIKSGNTASSTDVVKQLKGSLCVFEYCQAIAREFFDQSGFLSDYQKKFVYFKNTGVQRRTIGLNKKYSYNNHRPEDMREIDGCRYIPFNKLAA